jgi:hypothetical protein
MYRRKAGRAVEVEEDPNYEDDEDSDPELVGALEDGDLEPVLCSSTPLVKKGKGKVFTVGTARTRGKREPDRSKKGTAKIKSLQKVGRTMPISPVDDSEGEQEDFSAMLDAIGATGSDKDGVPYLPSTSQHPQSHIKQALSKSRSRRPVKSRGAGRNRGFATTSNSNLTRAQAIVDFDEVEDFTFALNNISDTSVEQ